MWSLPVALAAYPTIEGNCCCAAASPVQAIMIQPVVCAHRNITLTIDQDFSAHGADQNVGRQKRHLSLRANLKAEESMWGQEAARRQRRHLALESNERGEARNKAGTGASVDKRWRQQRHLALRSGGAGRFPTRLA